MRLLLEPPELDTLDGALAAARGASAAGLDGILLAATPGLPAPLVVAAAVGPAVPGILVAVEVEVGGRHPVELAEEAAVVDLACAGRLVLVAAPAPGVQGAFLEALDLLRTAWTPRPFTFHGETWTVPGRLPGNDLAPESARVTPAPLQPRPELWVARDRDGGGMLRGLGHLADADDDPARLGRAWAGAQERLGPALIGVPRGRREPWTGVEALLERLREGRQTFGQDWAAVAAPAQAAAEIGSEVRPRIQLDHLPAGLDEHWEQTRPRRGRPSGGQVAR
jgi:alkanesulfonate monooxygenase SsuD/methylene tetrahydromethanopterin reductase-like flavin-dependent oxidoreductase (luciferase family)